MTEALASVLKAAEALSLEEQEELWCRLHQRIAETDRPELSDEQWAEIRRRAAEVDSGEVETIPGEEVDAEIQQILAAARRRA